MLGFSAASANAADPYVERTSIDWSGFYLGGHFGYNWQDIYVDDDHEADANLDLDVASGGIHGGYNFAMSGFLLGIEADADFKPNSGTHFDDDGDDEFRKVDLATDYVTSVRARIGMPFDMMLVYGTVGVAFTNGYWTGTSPDGTTSGASFSATALVFGGGVEYRPLDDVSLRAEVLYYDWSDSQDFVNNDSEEWTGKLQGNTSLRVGASFHF